MYFDDARDIKTIAERCGCSVFVVPSEIEVEIPGAILLKPEEKSVITIEQVRDVTAVLATRQIRDVFVVVRPADKMGIDAANAFLKSLEEPQEKVHYVLITERPSEILPTILSRANLYILRRPSLMETEFRADEKVKALAKKYIVAKPADLVELAEEVTKKKDGVRERALLVLGTTIEMLYRSYFMTGKEAFVAKIPKFLKAYEAISQNGHIKLHLVADLI